MRPDWEKKLASGAQVFGRIALGLGFLSAVADRFGLWGRVGAPNVAWGDFGHFLEYTAKLNPYLPEALVPALGWAVTIAETVAGVALVAGTRVRAAATLAAILLLGFTVGMTVGTGVKSALDASVPAAAAAALLLAAWPKERRARADSAHGNDSDVITDRVPTASRKADG
jgi:thiosulfate dehydrogenase (quinone) large subunit